jgi:Fe-S-cluster containining protein
MMEIPLVGSADARRWLSFHGKPGVRIGVETVILDCECQHLVMGKCSIYNDRPEVCREMKVGGPECKAAIRIRRKDEAKKIMNLL